MTGSEFLTFLGAAIILAVTPGPDTFLTIRFGAQHFRAGLVYTAAITIGITVWAVFALTGIAALLQRFPEVRTGLTIVGGCYLVYLGAAALWGVRKEMRSASAGHTTASPALAETGQISVVPVVADSFAPEDARVEVPVSERNDSPEPASGTDDGAEADSPEQVALAVSGPAAALGTRSPNRVVFRTGLISSLTNPKTGIFFLALLPPFLPASPTLVDQGILVLTVAGCIIVYSVLLSAVADRIGRLLTTGSGPLVIDTIAGVVLVLLGISILVV